MPRRGRHLDDSDDDVPGPSQDHRNMTKRASTTRSSTSRASQAAPTSHASSSRASQAATNSRNDTNGDPYEFTQSSQRGNASKIPEEEEDHLISSVIRYLLVADQPKTLIQRANIIKAAMPNHSKHFKYIMTKVKPVLSEIFGYRLVELEGSKYILTNNLTNRLPHLHFSKREKAEQVLLFITLAHVFMLDDTGCREEDLFDLFRALEIIEDTDYVNEYFGDVKYLLTDKFLKQGYLVLVTVDQSDPPVKNYQWGARAEEELTPRHILEFMSKIFGGRPLNTWPVQFQIMQSRENSNRTG